MVNFQTLKYNRKVQRKIISAPRTIPVNNDHMTAMQIESEPRDLKSERAAKLEKNVKLSFKITHNRHHNVNIVTFSTGPAVVVMGLNITVVQVILQSADEGRSERLIGTPRETVI